MDDGQKVRIAYHFYKRCFSIRDAHSRRVIGYADRIVVRHVKYIVVQSGRERALRERMKNVHAFVEGEYVRELQAASIPAHLAREAFYNPYHAPAFMDRGTMKPVLTADLAICEQGKVYYQA